MPETIPNDYVKTPEEEFRVNNKPFIDRAITQKTSHVSLIWHAWSLNILDPEMKKLDITFRYVHERDIPAGTFLNLLAEMRQKTEKIDTKRS